MAESSLADPSFSIAYDRSSQAVRPRPWFLLDTVSPRSEMPEYDGLRDASLRRFCKWEKEKTAEEGRTCKG